MPGVCDALGLTPGVEKIIKMESQNSHHRQTQLHLQMPTRKHPKHWQGASLGPTGQHSPILGADLHSVKTCEMCKKGLIIDLADFNMTEFFQKHQQFRVSSWPM